MNVHELFHGFSALSNFARLVASHPLLALLVLVALVGIGYVVSKVRSNKRAARRGVPQSPLRFGFLPF